MDCVTDEISPNGLSESRVLPGLHTVLAVNKRQFPESEVMKVRADWRSENTSQELLSGSTVGSSDPVQVIIFKVQFRSIFKVCIWEGTRVP